MTLKRSERVYHRALKGPVPKPLRPAQLMCEVVAVLCPYCGDPQPNPSDGSEQWERRHFVDANERKQCSACDEWMHVFMSRKVQFS